MNRVWIHKVAYFREIGVHFSTAVALQLVPEVFAPEVCDFRCPSFHCIGLFVSVFVFLGVALRLTACGTGAHFRHGTAYCGAWRVPEGWQGVHQRQCLGRGTLFRCGAGHARVCASVGASVHAFHFPDLGLGVCCRT